MNIHNIKPTDAETRTKYLTMEMDQDQPTEPTSPINIQVIAKENHTQTTLFLHKLKGNLTETHH